MSVSSVSELRFPHQLADQAIHDALDPQARARLHILALDILEELHPQPRQGLVHELAWHAAQALQHPPAGQRSLLERRQFNFLKQIAAEVALGVRYQEIRQAYVTICDHPLADDAERLSALVALADCANRLGQAAEVPQRYRAALTLAEKLARPTERFHCLNNLALHLRECGKLEEAESLLQAALALAKELNDMQLEIRALGNFSGYLLYAGRVGEALITAKRAYAMSLELGDVLRQALCLSNVASIYHVMGRFEDAETDYVSAGEILRRQGQPQQRAVLLGNLAQLKQSMGAAEESRRLMEEALQGARDAGLLHFQAKFTGLLATYYKRQGLDLEAEAMHREARATLRELGDKQREGLATGHHAAFSRDRGELARSFSLFAEADELLEGDSRRDLQASMRGARAATRTLLGDFAGAESDLEFVHLYLSTTSFGPQFLEHALVPRIRLALARALEPEPDNDELAKAVTLGIQLESERQRLKVLDSTELGEVCVELRALISMLQSGPSGAETPLIWRGHAPARLDPRLRLALLERLRQYEPGRYAALVRDARLYNAMASGTTDLPMPNWRGI